MKKVSLIQMEATQGGWNCFWAIPALVVFHGTPGWNTYALNRVQECWNS